MTEPTTRLGKFLWRLSGHEVDITPRNELEECLDAIASGSGSGGGAFPIFINEDQIDNTHYYTMDKTFAEIDGAMRNGKMVFADQRIGDISSGGIIRKYVVGIRTSMVLDETTPQPQRTYTVHMAWVDPGDGGVRKQAFVTSNKDGNPVCSESN